jgi:hypothetical protein
VVVVEEGEEGEEEGEGEGEVEGEEEGEGEEDGGGGEGEEEKRCSEEGLLSAFSENSALSALSTLFSLHSEECREEGLSKSPVINPPPCSTFSKISDLVCLLIKP